LKYTAQDVRFTAKPDALYASSWIADEKAVIKSLAPKGRTWRPVSSEIVSITMLGDGRS